MRNLIEYMPPFLKNVREFNKIFDAEDVELQNLNSNMNLLLTETIVNTAKSFGLDRYEEIYGIESSSNATVEARRINILLKMNCKIPYTYNWLINFLNTTVGENGYTINLDYDNYTLTIQILEIYSELASNLEETLRKQIPANMELSVDIFQTEEMANLCVAGIVHQADFIEIS